MEIIKKKEENKNLKQKVKLIIILAVEFVAIMTILLLILFAGKKTHTVTFDLNGGILISGDLEQRVTQGQSAHPPTIAKFGHYLRGWSGSYKSVTRDVTVKAIWEYETTPGIEYYFPENTNYCEISGSFKELQGEIFIGSFYNERQVLGIQAGAFKGRTGITSVHLLDGILAIEEEAFAGCSSLEAIDIPSTVVRIGKGAFAGCENLKELILPESLKTIEEGAFAGCSSIEEIVFPKSLLTIGDYAFAGCTSLATVELYYPQPVTEDDEKDDNSKDKDKEEEKEPVEVDTSLGLSSIGAYAFYGCDALLEIFITESVTEIGVLAFNTPKMTINLCISQSEIPEGFADGWHRDDATLVFDYEPPVKEPVEDENDKDDKKNNLWGNNS